jgi:hypothetical protein
MAASACTRRGRVSCTVLRPACALYREDLQSTTPTPGKVTGNGARQGEVASGKVELAGFPEMFRRRRAVSGGLGRAHTHVDMVRGDPYC